MIHTRWRKVFQDLLGNKTRTILVILAIAVGVFSVGFVASAQSMMLRELDRGYEASNKASATLYTSPLDEDMVERIAQMPEVATAEGRRTIPVQITLESGETRDLILTAVPHFPAQLDKVFPLSGQWPPEKNAVLVERLSLEFIGATEGETITVELPDGVEKELAVAGLVHDPNVPNADIMERAFGYITMDTVDALGLGHFATELRYRVAADATNLDHIHAVSDAVQAQLEKSGYQIFSTNTPQPGEHWAQDIIETLVMLFTLFGFIILGLSGFLVVNTITALITQQIKQIGVMKLVGGRRRQVMSMYFIMVLSYGLISLVIGVPLGVLAAGWTVDMAAGLLNIRMTSYAIPASVIAMQTAVGLMVPLGAALWPVINGVQITTHKALNSLGISSGSGSQKLTDRIFAWTQRVLPVQRPLIIAVRNTIRKKGRLALTLATLIMGTALFISVLSVRNSVQTTIDNFLRFHQYDVSVSLERPYRAAQIEPIAQQLPGVVGVESWLTSRVRRVYDDDTTGEGISLIAAPADTQLIDPRLEDGRWLQLDDSASIVVNTDFLEAQPEPDVGLGDEIVLAVNGREIAWQIIGVVPSQADGPSVYVNYDSYARVARSAGQATVLKIVTDRHDAEYQGETAVALADHLEASGISVNNTRATESIRATNEFRFSIVIGFLILMAILLAVVGGLGLTTTMSINILERIREIGVLRAIGASDTAVRQIVLAEGIVIGLLSWTVGSLLSLPTSRLMSEQVGLALLGFPLNYNFALGGTFLWLGIIIFLATAASLGPARSASRLTIREVLAYE
ncbi:MAG: ABC transporter permease [Chloroflexi bacterium]|nr:ABC transporter permease [Chloroflexota bacterium]